MLARSIELSNQFLNAIVRFRGVQRMMQIMLPEDGVSLVKTRITVATGNGADHQQAHTIAHKTPHLVNRTLRHAT